jgi:hypothetical protein
VRRFACWLCLSLLAWAQVTLDASLSTYRCQVGEQVVFSLKLSGAQSDPLEPNLPDIPGLSLQNVGVSKNMSMINGVTNSETTFTYIITPLRQGSFQIPSISLGVDGQRFQSQALTLQVGSPAPPPTGANSPSAPLYPPPINGQGGPPAPSLPEQPPAQPVFVECEVSNRRPFVNQLVVYTFRFFHRVQLQGNPNYEPAAATGFLREDLGQSTKILERNGARYSVSEVSTALFPTSQGSQTIASTRLRCHVMVDPFQDPNFLFDDPVRELHTEPQELVVLPLPSQGQPANFNGVVANSLKLEARLSKERVKVGEPFKLEISLEGDEHPDLLLDPVLPNWPDIKVFAAEISTAPFEKPNFRVRKTFRIPVVAKKPGPLQLSGLSYSFYSPREGRYLTLTATPLTIQVEGTALPEAQNSATPAPQVSEANPIRGPRQGADLETAWATRPALLALALLPWLLSAALLLVAGLQRLLLERSQRREARLARIQAKLKRAKHLEELIPLVYAGLELKWDRPLKGLPLHQLGEVVGEHLSNQLGQAEAARYAPGGDPSQAIQSLRQACLQHLEQKS